MPPAATDMDARERFAAIREALERRLSETPKGRKYRQEWFEEHHRLVIFDAAAGLKVTRKVPKAIWAWAKSWADVAAGYPSGEHKGEVPAALIKWADKQSSRFGGVQLLSDCAWLDSVSEKQARAALSPAEFGEWDRQRWKVGPVGGPEPPWAAKLKALEPTPFKFSPDRVAQLKAKVNLNPRLNGLFCMVDAVNLAFTMRALLDGDFKDGWTKSKADGCSREWFSILPEFCSRFCRKHHCPHWRGGACRSAAAACCQGQDFLGRSIRLARL